MIPCPECGKHCASNAGLAAHRRPHGIGITAAQKISPRHPDPDPIPQVTIAFSTREWSVIEQHAKTRNVTPTAIVRACVQHTVTTSTPNPFNEHRPSAALVVTDDAGQRICPDCGAQLVKKNPHGPGRFPDRCPDCARAEEPRSVMGENPHNPAGRGLGEGDTRA